MSGTGADTLKVDLRPVRAERGATVVVTCRESIASGIAETPFRDPVTGTLVLTNLGSALRVDGRLQTTVDLTCDRCAAPFPHRLEARVLEDLDWSLADGAAADALEEAHLIVRGEGVVLDVEALAREALALALPMGARCRPDCAGLCERCGAELRLGPCACARDEEVEETVDPRLRPLAAIRDRRPAGPS